MAEELKRLEIGMEHFEDIKKENLYYVDKTGFIKELLENRGKVNLFTRPRRFGKSFNMSMIKNFFETGTDKEVFEGLAISREEKLCADHMGRYPVISITLKNVEGREMKTAYYALKNAVTMEIRRVAEKAKLPESKKLSEYDRVQLEKMLWGRYEDIAELTDSLRLFSGFLYKHYGQRVILLIDEYDVPLDKAYENGYYDEMVSAVRGLLGAALKSNDYLYFAVLTGCLRIARESIFTGLNNFAVYSVSDMEFSKYFGFTDEEVKDMLHYYGVSESYEVMKEWYDGYQFGDTEVYCPWDVVNYLRKLRASKNAKPESYWINSSSNSIIQNILSDAGVTTKDELGMLISDEVVEKKLMPELTYTDFDHANKDVKETYLWSVMLATGYLTETGKTESGFSRLKIPNREIREIYEEKILGWFKDHVERDEKSWQMLCDSLKEGDAERFQEFFNLCLSDSISIRDTFSRKEMKENFYHGMLLGILQCEKSWVVRSNQESGNGYIDIMLKMPKEKTGCILEVKYAENGAFTKACEDAVRQIAEKNYAEYLIEDGMETIHAYGVACYKKRCQVMHKSIK